MKEIVFNCKLKFIKCKKLLKILIVIACIIIFLIVLYFFLPLYSKLSAETKAVITALAGALVGGFCSLGGSIWVNSQQVKQKNKISLNDLVYKPLYDELLKNKQSYDNDKKYSSHINVLNDSKSGNYHNHYEWEKIKNNNKYILVPKDIKNTMNELESIIVEYNKVKISSETVKYFNTLLDKYGLENIKTISTMSDYKYFILNKKENDFFNLFKGQEDKKHEIDQELKLKLNKEFMKECFDLPSVEKARKLYDEYICYQNNIIKLLAEDIKSISDRYGN